MTWLVCAIDKAHACCFWSMVVLLGCIETLLMSEARMLNEVVPLGMVVAWWAFRTERGDAQGAMVICWISDMVELGAGEVGG